MRVVGSMNAWRSHFTIQQLQEGTQILRTWVFTQIHCLLLWCPQFEFGQNITFLEKESYPCYVRLFRGGLVMAQAIALAGYHDKAYRLVGTDILTINLAPVRAATMDRITSAHLTLIMQSLAFLRRLLKHLIDVATDEGDYSLTVLQRPSSADGKKCWRIWRFAYRKCRCAPQHIRLAPTRMAKVHIPSRDPRQPFGILWGLAW